MPIKNQAVQRKTHVGQDIVPQMNIQMLRTARGTVMAASAAVLATVLVAIMVIPPDVSGGDVATVNPGGVSRDVPALAPEDLSSFTGSVRWGVSLEEILETIAEDDLAGRRLNPALRRMGFLGLIETGNVIAVLLASPSSGGGSIVQLAPGDTLPDGRVLSSVTDNSITLIRSPDAAETAANAVDREVLLLFPRNVPGGATETAQ